VCPQLLYHLFIEDTLDEQDLPSTPVNTFNKGATLMDYEKRDDVAVFFDFENIVFSLRNNYNINANFEDLMDKCKEFGRVVVAHAFADWNRHSPAMIPALMSNGFDPVYVPSFTMGNDGQQAVRKNAVDMYMAIDAMDILHNRKSVDTFVLLTGDSDFLPLVNAIRREGNRVIAIGVDGSTSSYLAQAVDEFIFYSHFSEIPTADFQRRPRNVYEGLVEAIKQLHSRQRSSVLPNVKMMMAELMGGFDEKKHTDSQGRRFQKFKEFVQEGERRGLVKLVTTGTVNEVFLVDELRAMGVSAPSSATSSSSSASSSSASSSRRERERPEVRETRESKEVREVKEPVTVVPTAVSLPTSTPQGQPDLPTAYALLAQATAQAIAEGKSTRASSIKGLISTTWEGFNEKEIEVDGQKPFGRFGEFLNAAESAGVIKMSGKGHARRILPGDNAPAPVVVEAVAVVGGDTAVSEPETTENTEAPISQPEPSTALAIPPKPRAVQDEDAVGREIIVAGLRSFDAYPAPFLKIEAHCRQVRNERNVYLPSPKVRDLLTAATRSAGLLKRISPPGVSPAQYEFKDDAVKIALFLGEEAAPAPVSEPEVSATPEPTETVAPVVELVVETAVELPTEEAPVAEAPVAPVEEEVVIVLGETTAVEEPETPITPEPEPEPETATSTDTEPLPRAFALLAQVTSEATANGRSTRITTLKGQMRKLDENFDEKNLLDNHGKPFKRLSDFVQAAADAGYVTISGAGRDLAVHPIS
jgi:uncharacterized protein (TIGR00288 family)